jgi:hypothetical protein
MYQAFKLSAALVLFFPTITSAGTLYLTATSQNRIYTVNTVSGAVSSFPNYGTSTSEQLNPTVIAAGQDGYIYVADTEYKPTGPSFHIAKFTPAGQRLGSVDFGLTVVRALAVNAAGEIILTDRANPNGLNPPPVASVKHYSASGQLLNTISDGVLFHIAGVKLEFAMAGDGTIYIPGSNFAAGGASGIAKFTADDTYLGSVTNGSFSAVGVDLSGVVYGTTTSGGNHVQKFSSAGAALGEYGTNLSLNAQVFDAAGNLYQVSGGSVFKWSPAGVNLGAIATGLPTTIGGFAYLVPEPSSALLAVVGALVIVVFSTQRRAAL